MYTCPSSTFFCIGPACLESVPAFKNTTPGSRTVSPLWWIEIFFRLRKYYEFIRGWKKITGTAKRCNVKQSFRHRQIFLNLPRWLGTAVSFFPWYFCHHAEFSLRQLHQKCHRRHLFFGLSVLLKRAVSRYCISLCVYWGEVSSVEKKKDQEEFRFVCPRWKGLLY